MPQKIYTLLPLADSEEELVASLDHLPNFGPRGGMVVWVEGQECVKVPLTRGRFALIDRSDYERIGRYPWHAYPDKATWYARRGFWESHGDHHQLVRMHQEVLEVFDRPIDHKNRNGLDNRRRNIRVVTRGQNRQNSRAYSSTGFKGVYRTPYGHFVSQLRVGGQLHHFGTFQTAIEAARRYDEGALLLFGADAGRNFQDQS